MKYQRWHAWCACFLGGLILLLVGCSGTGNSGSPQQAATEDTSPVAFSLDDTRVTASDYEERLRESIGPGIADLLEQGQTRAEITEIVRMQNIHQAILDEMIQEELLLRVANQEGLSTTPDEVEALVEERLAQEQAHGSPSEPTEEELQELRDQAQRQSLLLQVVAQHTTIDSFNSKHILVEDEATAEEVVEKLDAGEDFADLASEYSQDPGSKDTGGSYGWVERGNFVPEYEEAAFTAELDTPVIVQSQFGYHVIVVEDRKTEQPVGIEELLSSQNAQAHIQASFVPWYDELRAEAVAAGDLQINEDFDPASVPIPFPEGSEAPTPAVTATTE